MAIDPAPMQSSAAELQVAQPTEPPATSVAVEVTLSFEGLLKALEQLSDYELDQFIERLRALYAQRTASVSATTELAREAAHED